jgi:hypothetical protein
MLQRPPLVFPRSGLAVFGQFATLALLALGFSLDLPTLHAILE